MRKRIRVAEPRPKPETNNHGGKREPKKERRANGEGTRPRQRDDGRWVCNVMKNGVRKQFAGKTAEEAREKRKAWLESPTARDPDAFAGNETVADVLKAMLKRYKDGAERRERGRKWSTYETMRNAAETHLVPRVGSYDAAKISPRHVQGLYDDMVDDGISGALMQQCHKALRAAFRVLRPDLMTLIMKPEYTPRKWIVWTPAQVNAFLAYCVKTKHKWSALFRLALRTGCRLGELLALTSGDFDTKTRKVSINKTWDTHRRKTSMWPKTESSIRTIKLTEDAFVGLAEHVVRNGLRNRPDARLFPLCNLGWFRDDFRKTAKAAKVPVLQRVHDLRHTFATNGLRAGVPVTELARIGGWKSC